MLGQRFPNATFVNKMEYPALRVTETELKRDASARVSVRKQGLDIQGESPVRHAIRDGLRKLCEKAVFVNRTAVIIMRRRAGYSKRKSAAYENMSKQILQPATSCPGKWTVHTFRTEFDAAASPGSLCPARDLSLRPVCA